MSLGRVGDVHRGLYERMPGIDRSVLVLESRVAL